MIQDEEIKMPINTREMFEKAYEIYHSPDQDVTPLVEMGMNENSANIALKHYKKFFAGEVPTRQASTIEVEVILNELYNDHDKSRLALVLQSMPEYLLKYPNKKMEDMVKKFEYNLIMSRLSQINLLFGGNN